MKLKEAYKYRSIWMGLALIWVVMFHIEFKTTIGIYEAIAQYGYLGCDIFLFASGLGIYYSLENNANLAIYLKKRIFRLMPMFWITLLVWLPFMFYTKRMTWQGAIGNVFGLQFFFDQTYDYNWYIPITLLCYCLAPFLKAIIEKCYMSRFKLLMLIIVVIFLMACALPDSDEPVKMMGMTRMPVFFIGMVFGHRGKKDSEISVNKYVVWLIMGVIGFSLVVYGKMYMDWNGWRTGMIWWPFMVSVPGICITISKISMALECNSFGESVLKFLSFLGRHSLEVYLAHATGVMIYRDWLIPVVGVADRNRYWFILLLICLFAAVVLYWLNRLIQILFKTKE